MRLPWVSLAGVGTFYIGKRSTNSGRNISRGYTGMRRSAFSCTFRLGDAIELSIAEKKPPPVTYKLVKVFFGTDREYRKDAEKPYMLFTKKRGHELYYGACEVSIPRKHKKGNLEAPYILKRYRQDPEKHVVLMHVDVKSKDDFFIDVLQKLVEGPKRKALIFVHGFNNSFEDAARRTAQIAHDIEFSGVPFFYSWPSQEGPGKRAYTHDSNGVKQAVSYLTEFLRDIALKGEFDSIVLIAHSMGNVALTNAVISLKHELNAGERKRFKEIILAAPDIDIDDFRNNIAPALVDATKTTTTLYASSKDLALIASKKHNGGVRAGDSGSDLVIMDGIETVDATNADTNLFWGLGHAYIADSKELLSDLFHLIEKGMRAYQRFGLEPKPTKKNPKYWFLKK